MGREGKHVHLPSASTSRCVQMLDLIKRSYLRRITTFFPLGFRTPYTIRAIRLCSEKSGPRVTTSEESLQL